MNLTTKYRLLILLGLAAAIASTRMSHFGTSALLPDASLAVFLVGGILLQRLCGFTILMAVAFGTDVFSARSAVEAGWCLTPAYWGLIPTYGLLWLAGRWLGKQHRLDFITGASVSLAAIACAFLVSNAFWFLLSNTVTDLTAMEYMSAVAKYFPSYLGSALLYLVPLWLGWKLTRESSSHKSERT
jgi:hypothetical protein